MSEYDRFHRRSIRLPGYDYASAGAYFITLCVERSECSLGQIEADVMQLSLFGQIVYEEWLRTPKIRREIKTDAYVIMPNHFHAIFAITTVGVYGNTPNNMPSPNAIISNRQISPNGYPKPFQSPSRTVGAMVRGFKSASTRRINILREMPGCSFWQRNYYEHIIRNEDELNRIREYVVNNPARWAEDREYPQGPKK